MDDFTYRRVVRVGVLALVMLLWLLLARAVSSAPAAHATVTVSTTADEYDLVPNGECALREAIKSQNDNVNFGGCVRGFIPGPGTDAILLPSGTYSLTFAGSGEDLDATGDLDIRDSVMISTTGALTATLLGGASWTDRIMHILTGTVTLKGLAIRRGHADGQGGGGVRIESGQSLTFHEGVVADSSAVGNGGGILNHGTAALTNVTLSGNSATGISSSGGGIDNAGTVTLTNVTVSGNTVTATNSIGGGIYNHGTATLSNVTLSGNRASLAGGAILNNGAATLSNVTVIGNGGMNGSGIYESGGTTTLVNTIVASIGVSGGNCVPSLGGSFNLSSDNSCGFGAGRDNVNVMLGPLANNGGHTLTHLPLGGSPAIDFGTNAGCPSSDQRGYPRPFGAACDVGAVERQLSDNFFLHLPLVVR